MKRTDIGRNITAYRKVLGLTQKEVAEQLGIPRSRYANWEAFASLPPVDYIPKLAMIMNVSCDDLFKPMESKKAQ